MDDHTQRMQGNLRTLTLLQAMRGAGFFLPVWVIFLLNQNLNFTQILILQTALACTIAAWQLPSGHFSDRRGRRITLIIASLCDFLAVLTYCLGTSFWSFLLGHILFATGLSFASGTIEALAYESLVEGGGDPKDFRRTMGRLSFAKLGAEAAAAIATIGIVALGLRATFWLTLITYGIGLLLTLTLEEPRKHQIEEAPPPERLLAVCVQTIKNSAMRSLMLLETVLTALGLLLYWFTQPLLTEIGIPLRFFGLLHAGIVFGGALAGLSVHAFERWIPDWIFYSALSVAIVGSYILLGSFVAPFAITFFFIVRISWGFLTPLTSDLLTRLAPPASRATVLSLRGLTFQLLYAPFPPLLGIVADRTTLGTALLTAGIGGGAIAVLLLVSMRGVWGKIPS